MTKLVIASPRRPGALLDTGAIRPNAAPRPLAALLRSSPALTPTDAAIRGG